MKKLIVTGLFVGTLALGAVIGRWYGARSASRAFARITFTKPQVDAAFLASLDLLWSAQLRLGEVDATVKSLENAANINLANIATWEAVAPPDGQIRKARDGFLTAVKTYQESYPVMGRDADIIRTLLSTVPGRTPQSTCTDAICRLDNIRLAKLPAATNSP